MKCCLRWIRVIFFLLVEMKTNEASDVANSAPQKKKTIKCMVVGDCAAEKTALLSSYTSAYDNSSVKRSPIVSCITCVYLKGLVL